MALPPRALGVLTALLQTPGAVVSKQQLMAAVWPGTFVTESLSGGSAVRVSSHGGAWPAWPSDGATVYYRTRPDSPAELRVVLDWFSELASRVPLS